MSGGYEEETFVEPEKVSEVRNLFQVDEKTARKIIDFATVTAMERMKKWINNYRRHQKDRAEDIYRLTKLLKKSGCDKKYVDDIEKIVLEMCVEQ